MGLSGAVLGGSWAVLGSSRAFLEPKWAVLEPWLEPLGRSWSNLGSLWSRLGPVLAQNSENLKIIQKPSTKIIDFCRLGPASESSWAVLGASWPAFGSSWASFGVLLSRLGARVSVLKLVCGPLRPSWALASRHGPAGARRGGLPGSARAILLTWAGFLLARASVRHVGEMTSGSSFASHISPSSAKARCHCSPFSHALIPAL